MLQAGHRFLVRTQSARLSRPPSASSGNHGQTQRDEQDHQRDRLSNEDAPGRLPLHEQVGHRNGEPHHPPTAPVAPDEVRQGPGDAVEERTDDQHSQLSRIELAGLGPVRQINGLGIGQQTRALAVEDLDRCRLRALLRHAGSPQPRVSTRGAQQRSEGRLEGIDLGADLMNLRAWVRD